ncbi:MAG: trifunctional serine/threonine-protein kinase/ATP-binding protein/sensor histidine kinase [Thainema sp.]
MISPARHASPVFPQIEGYTIVEPLYLGSRTAVYRAMQTAPQRPVVIKVLQREYPSFGELMQFRNQYAIAQALTGQFTNNLAVPGVVQPYSLEPLGSGYALVMEDCGGISLSQYTQRHQLDLTDILTIALQLADILHDLSQHRVVHKDIKPANILIHPESKQIKLIDFSIASLLPRETQGLQSPNTLEGTLAYLAPEQTGRMNRGIDYRADFYAFGVTLYQLLTGTLPFQSEDSLELIHCHIAKMPRPVEQVNPEVPAAVAAIVAKLMAKNAEDRYQSALGLKHDLAQCLAQWQKAGEIAPFELGQRDLSDRFLIPEKLYGRQSEVQTLLDAFDRVAEGATELMLVAGFSGIGKTAVVNEVHKPIVRQRGYFIKGKYDQFNRSIPLSAFVQALRDLIEQLLSESDEQLQYWKTNILAALGENGQVLIDVIPELEQIIGSQPSAPELSGSAAQNRFNLLLQNFIEVFTTADHPLVIFLDDLQWADLASLQLMKLLLDDNGYLLMLGAYRDNEVSSAHPLMMTVADLKQAQVTVRTITLAPLTFEDTNHLVADTLNCAIELAQPLTDLIDRKTQGNPFFTTQFLKALHEDGHIHFDHNLRYWQCDIAQVTTLSLTDDVVEFMAQQLQKLSPNTQQVLQLAACMGNQFDLNTLAIVSEQSAADAAAALWPALQDGLILPNSQVYRFFQGENQSGLEEKRGNPTYRFLHDRIQQAAYSLIADDQRQATHLKMGQLLLHNASAHEQDERLFEIVNHLNVGCYLIVRSQDRQELAHLNLRAGRKAKAATAYRSTIGYFTTGISLLPDDAWERRYELTLALYTEAAEAARLSGEFELMETWIQTVLQQATGLLDKMKVYEVRLQAYQVQGQQLQAVELGREVLQQLDIWIPESVNPVEIQHQVEKTLAALGDRKIEDLLDLPNMTDAQALAALQMLAHLVPSVHQAAPNLFPLLACEEVNLSLRYGNALLSAPGYADFGIIVSTVLNQPEIGYQFGQLALELVDRLQAKPIQSMTGFKVAAFIQWNQDPVQRAIALLQTSYLAGMETGDLVHGPISLVFQFLYTYLCGADVLDNLRAKVSVYGVDFAAVPSFVNWSKIIGQSIENLMEVREQPEQLVGEFCDEATLLPALRNSNDELALHLFFLNKLMLSYWFNRLPTALDSADQGVQYLKGGAGMFSVPVFHYYDALARLAACSADEPVQQQQLLTQAEASQQKLATWAESSPANFLHRFHLVDAERYRILGNRAEAIDSYDCAIATAKANGFGQDEALANELAARFCLDWGKEKIAQEYLTHAYYGYAQWGATAKVQELEWRYPKLLAPILQQRTSLSTTETVFSVESIAAFSTSATQSSNFSGTGHASVSKALDLATVLKVSHTLSGAIEFDQLVATLLHTVLENAGADKGALLMPREQEWFVEAVAQVDQPVQLQPEALSSSQAVPQTLINTVKHSLQSVVIVDALAHPTLPVDTYVVQQQPKSMLCTPILRQGKLIAILYLENHVAVGAFTTDRVELLNLLCTQAAISLENARLYHQINHALQDVQYKEAQSRSIFEAASHGMLITDLETGRVIDANPAYYQLHGYSYDEILQLDPLNFIPPDRHAKFQSYLQAVKSGQEFTCEAICRHRDGAIFYIEVKSVPFWYNGQLCGLTVVRDMTQNKQMEFSIQDKNRSLEQAMVDLQAAQMQMVQSEKMSALGNLVAGVAHEINNPIGFLNGSVNHAKNYVQDLLEHLDLYQQHYPNPVEAIEENANNIDLEFLNEDLPKLLGSMQVATDRIKAISNSLRTFSRADTDYKVGADLHEGLDSTLLILKYRLKANEHRSAIEIKKEYGELPSVHCFPGQLNQVFMNILANAIDMFDEMAAQFSFSELSAVPQTITIQTRILTDQNKIEICIQDNGKGMTEEVRTRIFDPSFTTKGVGKGTGLGLAIAHQIIEQKHNGALAVQSEVGQGTKFYIHLPIGID